MEILNKEAHEDGSQEAPTLSLSTLARISQGFPQQWSNWQNGSGIKVICAAKPVLMLKSLGCVIQTAFSLKGGVNFK